MRTILFGVGALVCLTSMTAGADEMERHRFNTVGQHKILPDFGVLRVELTSECQTDAATASTEIANLEKKITTTLKDFADKDKDIESQDFTLERTAETRLIGEGQKKEKKWVCKSKVGWRASNELVVTIQGNPKETKGRERFKKVSEAIAKLTEHLGGPVSDSDESVEKAPATFASMPSPASFGLNPANEKIAEKEAQKNSVTEAWVAMLNLATACGMDEEKARKEYTLTNSESTFTKGSLGQPRFAAAKFARADAESVSGGSAPAVSPGPLIYRVSFRAVFKGPPLTCPNLGMKK